MNWSVEPGGKPKYTAALNPPLPIVRLEAQTMVLVLNCGWLRSVHLPGFPTVKMWTVYFYIQILVRMFLVGKLPFTLVDVCSFFGS